MFDRTPEEQAHARYVLMQSAVVAQADCFSMREWMDSRVVLDCVERYQLDESIVEHIAYWVWDPVR